ncbi:hypothetical protein [Collimonas fungivorans]|uniref:hypothetical protein n=1 Tax=Collimonas fungivorans TaxID=158899 RepID=UPI003FA370FB
MPLLGIHLSLRPLFQAAVPVFRSCGTSDSHCAEAVLEFRRHGVYRTPAPPALAGQREAAWMYPSPLQNF